MKPHQAHEKYKYSCSWPWNITYVNQEDLLQYDLSSKSPEENTMSHSKIDLAGKSAIMTGPRRKNGNGATIVRALASNGADVAIHYVSENSKSRAQKVASDIA